MGAEREKFRKAGLGEGNHERLPNGFMIPALSQSQRDEINRMDRAREALEESFAADPELREHMLPWMLDFEGSEEPPEGSNLEALIGAKFGELPRIVSAWLEKHQARVTDSGSGLGGWHFGALCSDEQATRLCRLAREELRVYLDAKVLTMRLRFWGWRFEDMYHAGMEAAFLAKQAAS